MLCSDHHAFLAYLRIQPLKDVLEAQADRDKATQRAKRAEKNGEVKEGSASMEEGTNKGELVCAVLFDAPQGLFPLALWCN